jgi:molybdopterin-containing oxidoreductase family iron-sulfur binding subunit
MKYTRKELLKKASLAGIALCGGASMWELVFGDETAPAERPGARRWALALDMRKCLEAGDCSRCIDICHRTHNVPSIADPLREIKWIWKEPVERVFPDIFRGYGNEELRGGNTVVLCNHCEDAPCVRVCPTGATFRRADGIVMMDQHRCIGCRYCMAACPYGARSFNWHDPRKFLAAADMDPDYPTRTKGVVEKCDLCAERIDGGLAPACVGACDRGALLFGNLLDGNSAVRAALRGRFALRRRAELDTDPGVYYVL